MSSIGVISDLHGSVALLHGILRKIGATDAAGKRQPGWHLVSVGDAVGRSMTPRHLKIPQSAYDERGHLKAGLLAQLCLVEQARDFAVLEEAQLLLDGVCMGNHEGVDFGLVDFGGYDREESPVKQRVRDLARSGFIHAAEAHGDWLVTHAGLATDFWEDFPDLTPAGVAEQLNRELDEVVNTPGGHLGTFRPGTDLAASHLTAIGPERWAGPFRMPTPGGIMWCGWNELAQSYQDYAGDAPLLKQIVGHTPPQRPTDPSVRKNKQYPLVNIDAGANEWWRVGAAVSHDGGTNWSTHVYENVLKV